MSTEPSSVRHSSRDVEREQRWRSHVTAWRERGVPARVYCEEHGLSVNSLYAWSRRLPAQSKSSGGAPEIVAVEVMPDDQSGAWIEIAPDGTVRVPAELESERLAAVVQAVRRAC